MRNEFGEVCAEAARRLPAKTRIKLQGKHGLPEEGQLSAVVPGSRAGQGGALLRAQRLTERGSLAWHGPHALNLVRSHCLTWASRTPRGTGHGRRKAPYYTQGWRGLGCRGVTQGLPVGGDRASDAWVCGQSPQGPSFAPEASPGTSLSWPPWRQEPLPREHRCPWPGPGPITAGGIRLCPPVGCTATSSAPAVLSNRFPLCLCGLWDRPGDILSLHLFLP